MKGYNDKYTIDQLINMEKNGEVTTIDNMYNEINNIHKEIQLILSCIKIENANKIDKQQKINNLKNIFKKYSKKFGRLNKLLYFCNLNKKQNSRNGKK